MGKMLTIRTVGEGKLLFSIIRKPIGNKLMGLLGFNLLLHRQNIQGKNLLVFLSDNIQIRIVIPLCYHNIGHGSIDVGLWGFPRQEQMQVQFAFFFMYEKGSLNACTSCPFRVEPKHSTVFHQMPDQSEMLHAVLDSGEPGTIHVFESLYGQFPGAYVFVTALADIAAIIRNVLDAKQMAERFPIEDNLQHRAVR